MTIIDKIAESEAAWLNMTKRRAFFRHLMISLGIVTTVFTIIFFIWYPRPYFEAVGTWSIIRILIGVDLVLGPLLTLVVYRPGKRFLSVDLVVIGLIQVSALIYGINVLYKERPFYVVFTIDRFVVLAEKDIAEDDRDTHPWMKKPMVGPVLATAELPDSVEEQQRIMDETVFEGAPDIEQRPYLWNPYGESLEAIRRSPNSLNVLRAESGNMAKTIDAILAELGVEEKDLAFFPISSPKQEACAIVNLVSGEIVRVLAINPWPLL